MKNKLLIYGASGYVGELLAKFFVERNLIPVLAGRRKKKFKDDELNECEFREFNVDQSKKHLADVKILVNVAGPFSQTQEELIKACIETKTNYLDITGEVIDIQRAFKYFIKAKEAGITVVPAAGFGVVPTDIAAKIASELIEKPSKLIISYATKGIASRGTVKTLLRDIDKPGFIVENGEFRKANPGFKMNTIKLNNQEFNCVYNPWRGDLFSARISTGIDHIETYTEFPGFIVDMMKGKKLWLRNLFLNLLINFIPKGPNAHQLKTGKTYIEARVENDFGQSGIVSMTGPEAYWFSIQTIALLMELIENYDGPYGVLTPSSFGTDWLERLKEVNIQTRIESLN